MTGFYYECPACTKVHPVDVLNVFFWGMAPDRSCDRCGQDGCVDCLPDSLCSSCQHEVDVEAELERVSVWDSDTWTMTDGASD